MAEFLFSFAFLLIIVAMMAVGVMRGRAPISGTCGGLNNAGVGGACDLCGGDTLKCEEIQKPLAATAAEDSVKKDFYDAS